METTVTLYATAPGLVAARALILEQLTDLTGTADVWAIQTERIELDDLEGRDLLQDGRSPRETQHQDAGERRYRLTTTAKLRSDGAQDDVARYRAALERIASFAEEDPGDSTIAGFANRFAAIVNAALDGLGNTAARLPNPAVRTDS